MKQQQDEESSLEEQAAAAAKKAKRDLNRFNGMSVAEVMSRTLPDVIAHNLDILIVSLSPPWICWGQWATVSSRSLLFSDRDQSGTDVCLQRSPLSQPWKSLL